MSKPIFTADRDVQNNIDIFGIESGRFSTDFARVVTTHSGYGFTGVVIIRRADGSAYIAAEVVKNLTGDFTTPRGDLRYGPGGRRGYVRITDKLVSEFIGFNQLPGHRKPSPKMAQRYAEVNEFCEALIAFI